MNNNHNITQSITASMAADSERPEFLPRFVGAHFGRVERSVYNYTDWLISDYSGGYWNFYALSNGGFYMAIRSDEHVLVEVETNGFRAPMSADAAGIVACLFALCALANKTSEDTIIERYHQLRDYACEHGESQLILRAID